MVLMNSFQIYVQHKSNKYTNNVKHYMNERIEGSLFLYPAADEKIFALVNNTKRKH